MTPNRLSCRFWSRQGRRQLHHAQVHPFTFFFGLRKVQFLFSTEQTMSPNYLAPEVIIEGVRAVDTTTSSNRRHPVLYVRPYSSVARGWVIDM